jgi:hypothetical protein
LAGNREKTGDSRERPAHGAALSKGQAVSTPPFRLRRITAAAPHINAFPSQVGKQR